MHPATFEYQKPTDYQIDLMSKARAEFSNLAHAMNILLPTGPDREHVLRLIRDASMWANVAITREADGSPRP